MILVDSSVWIDYLSSRNSRESDLLDRLLGRDEVLVGDLMITEVLQGFRFDSDYAVARRLLGLPGPVELVNAERSIRAADRCRLLCRKGITVRSTIDSLIAGFCIDEGIPLLYSDRVFDPFVEHFNMPVLQGL